jgi:hypothetical protein
VVPVPTLWDALVEGLSPIWPSTRTNVDGVSIGDAWYCSSMPTASDAEWEKIVPFHKLTQWLCYSLMVPMTKLMHVHFAGTELLTGLPEYRNGGLLIDTGLLTLKAEDAERGLEQYQLNAMKQGQPNMEVVPMFQVDDSVIVEWRALTVGFLDELCVEINSQLGLMGNKQLSLAQVLEAGTWKVCLILLSSEDTRLTRLHRQEESSQKSHDQTPKSHPSSSIRMELSFKRYPPSPCSFFSTGSTRHPIRLCIIHIIFVLRGSWLLLFSISLL